MAYSPISHTILTYVYLHDMVFVCRLWTNCRNTTSKTLNTFKTGLGSLCWTHITFKPRYLHIIHITLYIFTKCVAAPEWTGLHFTRKNKRLSLKSVRDWYDIEQVLIHNIDLLLYWCAFLVGFRLLKISDFIYFGRYQSTNTNKMMEINLARVDYTQVRLLAYLKVSCFRFYVNFICWFFLAVII